jgi:alanine racemase
MKYSIKEIASVLHFSADRLYDKEAIISELLTDSRSLNNPAETLFFAIRTSNNDGHRYIAPLYERGVRNFVIDNITSVPPELQEANFIVVPNSIAALQSIATYHRRRFTIPVIGITGSRGKTTVKEWLNQLLQDDFNIVRSPRSYNSQIGVPLSLWEIDDSTTLAIIEAGISQPGEMGSLQSMIRPTIGVITNIGNEHNEGFISLEQKATEKAQLLTACDCIIYCADDKIVNGTVQPILAVAQEIAWSRRDADRPLFISKIEKHDKSTTICYNFLETPNTVEVPFVNDSDIENVIICIAIMLYLHIPAEEIAAKVKKLTAVGTRLNVIEGMNNCMVIADSYTSDYNSLAPAIDFMARRSTPHTSMTVILSDVLHGSIEDDDLYQQIATLLANKRISRFIGIGSGMVAHSRFFDVNSQFFASTQEFMENMSQSDFEDELILVKGAPEFNFAQITDKLEAKQHQTVLEVNIDSVINNFNFFRSKVKPTTKLVCMVKASGYGAGSYELAKTLQGAGASYLAVAVHDEGVDLRKAGITMPIMVLNPVVVNYKAMFTYRLEPEVFSIDECKEIIREAEKYGITDYPVHIKLDTGMHRLGFLKEQLPELVKLLQGQNAIRPASVFSHLCVADEPAQDEYTRGQFKYFDECCEILQRGFQHHILRHILNTTGIVRFPEHQFDMVRVGIGLYGISTTTDGSESPLKPVSSLHSVIISIKDWPEGTTIGYGRKGVLHRQSRIATVPVGYADGFDRHFGNGHVSMYVNGTLCPTVGNVCMDVCMIDVTDAKCQVGDHVEIFGDHIPVTVLADVRGTIPYEILTSISNRVKRVYYRE